jgi:dihydrofolate synthase / folylpolyglutamate synthase
MPLANHPDPDAQHEAALRFLYDRTDYERALAMPYGQWGLELQRMRDLLARLGDPQQRLPIIHVAGTKGKGSTAAMIAAVLSAAGYRTGLFTSPHLDRVEERIAIDGRPCSPTELVELVDRVRPAVREIDEASARDKSPLPLGEGQGEGSGLTFFEITTAMALLHFAARGADAAVLEVGLGGRLDSTNVCQPVVAVITSISFDHVKQLGTTLEAIAREKAGIIKPGVPVVSGVAEPGPREVIRETCRLHGAPLVEMGIDFAFRYAPPRNVDRSEGIGLLDFHYRGGRRGSGFGVQGSGRLARPLAAGDRVSEPGRVADSEPGRVAPVGLNPAGRSYSMVPLRLLGHHQGANAAVALATLCRLQEDGWIIPEEAIRSGLGGLAWPARVELVTRRPAVVIDAAHNVASVEALIRVLDESFSPGRRLLLFATTREKDLRGMLKLLLGYFDHAILTRYLNNPRAVPVEELDATAKELTGTSYPTYQDPIQAWKAIRALATPDNLICVTGSFYIAAEIRERIREEGRRMRDEGET